MVEYRPAEEYRPEEKGCVKEEMFSAESHGKPLSDTIRFAFEKITAAAVAEVSVRGGGEGRKEPQGVCGTPRKEGNGVHQRLNGCVLVIICRQITET